MYDNRDDESYGPAEDDATIDIAEVHDNKDASPIYSDNNDHVK